VRILLDEQLPRQLGQYVVGHDVRTVQQESWAGLKNGALIAIVTVKPGQVIRVGA
jgi:hypothetical protein